MRVLRWLLLSAAACLVGAQGTINDLPRNETLIAENPEGTVKNAGWFNIWAINAGGRKNGSSVGKSEFQCDWPKWRGRFRSGRTSLQECRVRLVCGRRSPSGSAQIRLS